MQPKNSLPSSRLFRHQSIIPKLTTPSHTSETCRKNHQHFFTHKNVINYQRCINALNISEIFFYVIFVVCRLSFFIFFQCVFYRIIQIRYYIILYYYINLFFFSAKYRYNLKTTNDKRHFHNLRNFFSHFSCLFKKSSYLCTVFRKIKHTNKPFLTH